MTIEQVECRAAVLVATVTNSSLEGEKLPYSERKK